MLYRCLLHFRNCEDAHCKVRSGIFHSEALALVELMPQIQQPNVRWDARPGGHIHLIWQRGYTSTQIAGAYIDSVQQEGTFVHRALWCHLLYAPFFLLRSQHGHQGRSRQGADGLCIGILILGVVQVENLDKPPHASTTVFDSELGAIYEHRPREKIAKKVEPMQRHLRAGSHETKRGWHVVRQHAVLCQMW